MRPTALHEFLAIILLALLSTAAARGAEADKSAAEGQGQEKHPGEAIYRRLCASCHGERGEGVEGAYDEPLVGDRAVTELADVIAETMPEDDPDACVGEEAALVAAYMHDAFYSPMAQMRNAPPRFELSRLTTPQYRNSVADLIAEFTGRGQWSEQRGLEADYFANRRFRREDRKLERIDAAIDFDFGKGSPIESLEEGKAFSIQWRGGLLAPETGTYKITIETPNAAVLKLNDRSQPLIDAKIRSGDRTEYSESIFLLAGRVYPLELEFYRSEFGSKDVGNTGSPTASIRLRWQPPGRADHVIPSRYFDPGDFPETLVVETPFPPDDSSVGYARGTSISRAWDEAATDAALEIGREVIDRLDQLAGVRRDDKDRDQKVRDFCRRFVERAMRGPLSESQRERYIERSFQESETVDDAVRRCILLALKSPQFLYPELPLDRPETHRAASRLALALWDSVPGDALIEALPRDVESESGSGPTVDTVRQQARRMVDDLRTHAKVHDFLHHWLRLEHTGEMSKDSQLYPDFSAAIVSDLRQSLDLFLEEVVWSDASDFRQLLTSDAIYLNRRLAEFYDVPWPEDAPPEQFQRISLQKDRSAGVLTHPLLMAGFAYTDTTSPIHRGVFLARNVLGRVLRPPPEAVSPLSPELHAGLTTRQRVALQTKPASCSVCHTMINPLGFALEHFDPVGRFRSEEKGEPIDASGSYLSRDGKKVSFDGVRPLANFLANSPEAHQAFVRHLFEHVTKQPVAAYGSDRLDALQASFTASGFHIRDLLVEIAVVYAAGPVEPTGRVAQFDTPGQTIASNGHSLRTLVLNPDETPGRKHRSWK